MPTTTTDPIEGDGYRHFSIPVDLDLLETSALDLLTEWVPGYEGNIIAMEFHTMTPGTGSGADQDITLEIDGVAPNGGALNLLLADTDTTGKIKKATAIDGQNGLNHFGKAGKISVKVAASGTAFTAGTGALVLTLQNTQDLA